MAAFDRQLLWRISRHEDSVVRDLNQEMANAVDPAVGTLLHFAVYHENTVVIAELLDLGADVNSIAGQHGTPLAVALCCRRQKIIRALVAAGADLQRAPDDQPSSLQILRNLQELRAHYTKEVICGLTDRFFDGDRPALLATLRGNDIGMAEASCSSHVNLLQALFNEVGFDPNSRDCVGKTGLHLCAELEDADTLRWLLELGAAPDLRDETGLTALHVSLRLRDIDCIEVLLGYGADPDIRAPANNI